MRNLLPILLLIFLTACPSDDGLGKSLCVKNNTNQRIYFWYSKDYSVHHFPDTTLQEALPLYINSASANNCAGAGSTNPDWQTIFSQLSEGKFSVYFFETYPETQEDWDELRDNMEELVYRKDTTFEELKANNYIIEYP